MRKPEATNDVLPKELFYLLSCDLGEWHCLYPLGKVVGGYQEEPELRESLQERPTTSSPHYKGPGAVKSVKVPAWPVGGGSELLTLWALPHVFLSVI